MYEINYKRKKLYIIEIWEISFDNIENIKKLFFVDVNCVFLLYDSMDKKSFEYTKNFYSLNCIEFNAVYCLVKSKYD